ncbi:hypothetical protein [Pseudomonas sp. TE50-2]|uniref:hypothetical protein n=1 Tax=Pseudomonas sp. TE50-2 TaxID=3142707 RepID=UPI003467D267
MSKDKKFIVPNDQKVEVKSIRAMYAFDDGKDSILQIFVIDRSDKEFTFNLSSPTLQAGAWAAFNALRSSNPVQVDLRIHDGTHEVYAIDVK